jgi:hypothetical protein
VVLLGDSIFDNARFVPERQPVIEQVRSTLPTGWQATLLAVDGNTVAHIPAQLARLPADATHLVLSIGGNDVILASKLMQASVTRAREALSLLADVLERFRAGYRAMLEGVMRRGLPLCVCTIYDQIPSLEPAERAALSGFNDVITNAVISAGLPLIDLRVICVTPEDFSHLSSIEPSVVGGARIASVICRAIAGHDFATRRTTVWV